ncbi:class I SAM-dependent methyltransferase [Streptomyces alfalfae]|uniref:Methyltransferase domain-containing protein n=1 Tax=Streptomyces alfalfae TaxID=1642299 RepID=A0A7T4PIZ6_9ACTN|nr:class I SAM-dependent methyltransferase [Streptomyces alfalfae]QQC91118.1 methyltransferase domain-containing protein [Streptomyces alfalfae]
MNNADPSDPADPARHAAPPSPAEHARHAEPSGSPEHAKPSKALSTTPASTTAPLSTPTLAPAPRGFDDLVAEAEAAPTAGWDFSWFEGRATEARPSWRYAEAMARRLATASAALDIQTGGGEVVASAATLPPLMVATEGWPANVAKATALLHPRGVAVVASPEDAPLPFADGAFDLVTSRHPVQAHFDEIARVLRPGGTYFAQHVGPASVFEVVEYFLGRQPEEVRNGRRPDRERAEAEAAGLEVVDLRAERLRIEFFDVGAVVHFLRKVVWMVPGFSVEKYRPRLRELHEQIQEQGPFVAHSTRHLFDLRKP